MFIILSEAEEQEVLGGNVPACDENACIPNCETHLGLNKNWKSKEKGE